MRDENLRNNVKNMIEEMRRQSIEEIAFYDMKDQFLSEIVEDANIKMSKINENAEELRAENLSPWQKKCCYYLEKNSDCDVSLKAVLMYALAFDFVLTDNRKLKQQTDNRYKYCLIGNNEYEYKYEYRGDTMNSYKTTMREYLRSYAHDDERVGEFLCRQKRNKNRWQITEKYTDWETCILDNFDNYFADILLEQAKDFIKVSDTLGNYVPVPFAYGKKYKNRKLIDRGKEFNGPRGFGATKDYWDLALMAIYEWYIEQDDRKMRKMLRAVDEDDESVKLCKAWLDSFKPSEYQQSGNMYSDDGELFWNEFVKKNYMNLESFIEIIDEKAGKYGKPKKLWAGHDYDNVMPNDINDYVQFFENTTQQIKERGGLIAKAVKEKLDEKDPETLLSELLGE